MYWRAQESGAFATIIWWDENSSPGTPQSGDTIDSNGYQVDIADIDLLIFSQVGDGFYSTKAYSQAHGQWGIATWNARSDGTGATLTLPEPPATNGITDLYSNGFWTVVGLGAYLYTMHNTGGTEFVAVLSNIVDRQYVLKPNTQYYGGPQGTYDPLDHFTDPTESKVVKGASYVYNGVTKNGSAPRQMLGVKAK